jgi:outer membrane protein
MERRVLAMRFGHVFALKSKIGLAQSDARLLIAYQTPAHQKFYGFGAPLALAKSFLRKIDLVENRSFVWTILLALGGSILPTQAETMSGALAKAYLSNADLKSARAATRAVDENLARATSGFRPTISASADFGVSRQERDVPGLQNSNPRGSTPRGYSITVQQNIWNGNRTANSVRQAESQVLQSREQMRISEQTLLANAAAAYMDVLRDIAILNLRRNNVEVLKYKLTQTRERLKIGEVTRTDLAQSEAALAEANSQVFVAQSNLQASGGNYRLFIGEPPRSLSPAQPLFRLMPKSLEEAIRASQNSHPQIQAALHNVDAAALSVRIAEGQLYPSMNLTGSYGQRWENEITGLNTRSASIVASLSFPIYDGGATHAFVRQNKEQLGQAQLQVDLAREQVRAQVVRAWGVWQNVGPLLASAQARVRAEEVALNGVRLQARFSQLTTLDVLNAQQRLVAARSDVIVVQRERVVSSYSLMSAVGDLNARSLGLAVKIYDPNINYDQVRRKWIGTQLNEQH